LVDRRSAETARPRQRRDSRVSQVHDNVAATDLVLPAEQLSELDAAKVPEAAMIYGLLTPARRQNVVCGGSAVASR